MPIKGRFTDATGVLSAVGLAGRARCLPTLGFAGRAGRLSTLRLAGLAGHACRLITAGETGLTRGLAALRPAGVACHTSIADIDARITPTDRDLDRVSGTAACDSVAAEGSKPRTVRTSGLGRENGWPSPNH